MSKDERIAEIGATLRGLQQSFDLFDEVVAERLGINRTDLRCLDLVAERGPVSAGELAVALRLSPAATTTVVDRLVKGGLVTRAPDPLSRRRVLVRVTGRAEELIAGIYGPFAAAGAGALSRFTDAELAVILDFLATARTVHEQQTDRVRAGS
ncbi:MarR family transcriptional regulator [Nocardia thailandica]|uniref:MarR family transcriptional regulator n=1 Tax=Nocardia thailandica TaxID=257275 RepID=A0ABW6PJW8_9NOCA|nr:MarR family transcriptional regulator [Nocardia thailandica]